MKIAKHDIAAIQSLGYTEDESQFLYIVATHSGYFLPRQFISFTGVQWGKRSNKFSQKIEARGHAGWREYQGTGRVYHLFSKTLYSEIGKENLRNRRRHSSEFIRTRLVLLDFVIENRYYDYLETEQQKLQYFCDQLGIGKNSLPVKAYEGTRGATPTLRYFVDKYPLFLDASNSCSPPVVTFSFVDPGLASIKAFSTHLDAYDRLFRELQNFHFLYIGNSSANFIAAENCFSKHVAPATLCGSSDDILRYFRLRKTWDEKKYALFSNEDIEALNDAAKRFAGARFEGLYGDWLSGRVDLGAVRSEFAERDSRSQASFATYLVRNRHLSSNPERDMGEAPFIAPLHP